MKERAARTLRAGLSYNTDDGVVLTSGWEHRNLLGGGEKFDADLTLGQQEQGVQTSLRLPAFVDDKTSLVLKGGVDHEERDAYTADTLDTGATLERQLTRRLKGGLGVGFTLAETEDIRRVAGSLGEALDALEQDHEFLTRGEAIPPDLIEAFVRVKRAELERVERAPHPVEMQLWGLG